MRSLARHSVRKPRTLFGGFVVVLGLLAIAPASSFASGNAVYTSTDATAQGCLNGAPDNDTNCNIYTGKDKVYLSGGPTSGHGLNAGDYFFAILDPGGQNSPIDGAAGNLSSPNDDYAARHFTINPDGSITNDGTHATGLDKDGRLVIQAMPYDDTTNPGGVYILAVCKWLGDNNDATKPSTCKYDAFKVKPETPPTQASDPVVTKDANATYKKTFSWDISKSVDHTRFDTKDDHVTANYTVDVTKSAGADSEFKVSGTIEVFNPNDGGAIHLSGVSDVIDPSTNCAITGAVTAADLTVPAEGTKDYSYVCDYGNTRPAPDSGSNVATATWGAQTLDDGTQLAASGGDSPAASWAFDDVPPTPDNPKLIDDCADVTDTVTPPGTTTSLSGDGTPLCESHTYYPSVTFDVPSSGCVTYDNKAVVTGVDNAEDTANDSASVKVCRLADDPIVTKSANPTFTRSFPWSISKDVDKTLFQKLSGSVTANYTIKATKGTGVDSAFKVSGTIHVQNPNPGGPITLDSLNDVIDPSTGCTVTMTAGLTIAASSTNDYPYVCDYGNVNPDHGKNTASTAWSDQTLADDSKLVAGTGHKDVTWAFGDPTTKVDDCTTVSDTQTYAPPLTPAHICATTTYTPSKTFPVPASGCVDYPNTASETTDNLGLSDSAYKKVRVCGPVGGEGTMGFWQNKNGQALITGGASTYGVCNSGAYLRTFNPFKDLSATATCKQVADYVTNVVKAASASGAAMNAMLKAQMLSTALDVYFTKVPGSGVNVDLTKINKPIGSGNFEDTSAAFPVSVSCPAGPKTVSQLLTCAASQSNSGGTTWYGQVKATQELAKDTFDAINNGVAFSI